MAQLKNPEQTDNATATVAALSAGITITGNVECEDTLQISGRVDGEVRCPTVYIDEGGVVDGAIHAERLRVTGIASGRITANDLAIEAGGTISGETSYDRIKVAPGGIIEGSFTHRAKPPQANEGDASLKLVTPAEPINPRHVFID